jgi:hypothetical protein
MRDMHLRPPSRTTLWRPLMWAGFALLLLSPLVAMPFTSEVNWGVFDFVAAAALLGGVGLAIELASRHIGRATLRLAIIAAAVAGGLLIWADAAVGVF